MKRIKKHVSMEYLLCLLLLLSPFLDAISFLMKTYLPSFPVSITSILRPVIPILVMAYIFFHDKKRKPFVIGAILYETYAIGHLVCFAWLQKESSCGTIVHEAQYLFNYTYMMLVFYLFYYFMQKKQMHDLSRYVRYFLMCYVGLLYLALLTGTSSSTYLTGIGYKGWNASGNAVGSILLLTSCLLLANFLKEKKKTDLVLLGFVGIYLMFLLGTRTGLLGFPLILIAYFCCWLLFRPKTKKQTSIFQKKQFWFISLVSIVMIVLVGTFVSSSATFQRQENLQQESNEVIDSTTGEESHITGDALSYVKQIQQGKMNEDFMSKSQQNSLVRLFDAANKIELSNQNRRAQQFLYHTFLIMEQRNPVLWLFGNGYLSNYSEMVLEMEFVALLYNFGILGFVLFLGVFVAIDFLALKTLFQRKFQVDFLYVFNLFSCLFAIFLSFFAGYTFFHVSCMLIIIILHLSLEEKRKEYIS